MFFFFDLEKQAADTFDGIMHIDEDGNEFWYARELQEVLEYTQWRNFESVIEKAKISCKNAGSIEKNHFAEVSKMVSSGVADIPIKDYQLSRFACYLIAQNGDPKKEVIALAQSYFAVQTRKQELQEQDFKELSEDERRLHLRGDVKKFNTKLSSAAHDAGVKNYGKFHNAGYRGLYDGETVRDTMKEISGTVPEELETPEKSIKEIEKEQRKLLKKK